MERKMKRAWQRKTAAVAAAMLTMSFGSITHAMPQGDIVRSGEATIQRSDDNKSMEINQSTKRVAIDWKNFDIANDERVNFRQPDASSIALNRVTGDAKSVIDGKLAGNGQVFVINPNGVLFGQNASVDVGSLVASTAKVSDATMAGFGTSTGDVSLSLDDANTGASVINEGQIKAEGGLVALHAAAVENNGTITNEGGKIALAAAKTISLSADTAGKINFDVDGKLAKASTLNTGALKADGGYVVMTAKQAGDVMSTVVNNTGTIEAKTLRKDDKGEILLDGGDNGIVSVNGTLDASGVEAGQSAGSIKAIGAETHVEDGAALLARGQVDGGLIETSGDYLEIGDTVNIDASGKLGKSGEWLLDPLEVIISEIKPDDAENASGDNVSHNGNGNKKSWISSKIISDRLSDGTDVTIEARDVNKAATITVDSAITKRATEDGAGAQKSPTFTLNAESNITINSDITADNNAGALNVVLHSDTDGNGIGAVIINADINTNGGFFTSGNGASVEKGTVGTYFGNNAATGNRTIKTNGGAVNLYGDVAIGLNGGTLTIDTQKTDGSGNGDVLVTGTINSGNSYTTYSVESDMWDEYVNLVKSKYTTDEWSKQLEDYYNQFALYGWRALAWELIGHDRSSETPKAYSVLTAEEKSSLERLYVANLWDEAKAYAEKGRGDQTGDSYLATITTALENSLVSQGREYPLFVGGKGSGNRTAAHPDPADPDHPDGYYWVTGPEGLANGGMGTQFADTNGTPLNNFYANWNNGATNIGGGSGREPSNSGPYVSVGYGTSSLWDDVNTAAETTRGFIKETNLAHSGLDIQAGTGKVALEGNVGFSMPLSSLTIHTTGDVKVGGGQTASGSDAGTTYTGQIHTDNDINITGGNVNIGDLVQADAGNVTIHSKGNIDVDGIQADGKIKLISTGEAAAIKLNHTYNDGALVSRSAAKDAVIIDAQGEKGYFVNDTTAEKAIATGEGGSWKIYTSSPDRDTFGSNLNSGTNAQWAADSTIYAADTDTNSTGKYIFRVQPTISLSAKNLTKTYGDTLTSKDFTDTLSAKADYTYTTDDGVQKTVDVTQYEDAYQEGNLLSHLVNKDIINALSNGMAETATRTAGIDNTATYAVSFDTDDVKTLDGYALNVDDLQNVTLEILKRKATVTGTGEQTYGNSTLTKWDVTQQAEDAASHTGFVNGDTISWNVTNPVIDPDSTYADSQNKRATADAGIYDNAIAVDRDAILAANADVSANYDLTFENTLRVNKAKLNIHTDDINTTYGTVKTATTTIDGLTNGDPVTGFTFDYGDYGRAYLDNNTRTNAAGRYTFKTSYADPDFLKNYDVTNNDATVTIMMPQQKPDIEHNTTTNLNGSGSYTNNLGSHGIPGVDRVAGLASAELPFFKVQQGTVRNYGTYSVAADPDKVTLEATGKRLPEPDQPKTQYREYTKELTTTAGTGTFRMVYDGSTFRIRPVDAMAQNVVANGDATRNVELFAKALQAGFNEMGILLEDLNGVYVHFDVNN